MRSFAGSEKADEFDIKVDPSLRSADGKMRSEIVKSDGDRRVKITGSSGVAVAWIFHHYLKYSCSCHFSWETSQLSLPATLPNVNLTLNANDKFR